MSEREAWIIDGVRTPRGKGKQNGALHHVHPQELLAQCLQRGRAAHRRADHGDRGRHRRQRQRHRRPRRRHRPARRARRPAGRSPRPGLTINRFCGSGQQAVGMAATGVLSGHQDLVIGGGVESMSRPFRHGYDGVPGTMDGDNPLVRQKYPLIPQGISADLIATVEGFSRTDCDELAVSSPGARRQGHRRGPLRQERHPGAQRGRLGRPRPRGVPPPRHDARAARQAGPELRGDGRHAVGQVRRRDVRRDVPAHVPAASTRSTTSTTPATPPASSTARRRSSWPRRTTPGPTASSRGPASA